MILLGLDPSLTATGWGLVRAEGTRLSYIASGTIRVPAALPMPERLAVLAAELRGVIDRQRPHGAACEEVFANKNPQSTLKLGQARGAVLLVCGEAGLNVGEYASRLVKKALTGTGTAEKRQVRAMVERLLPGAKPDSADAADALAVAITHAHHARTPRVMHA